MDYRKANMFSEILGITAIVAAFSLECFSEINLLFNIIVLISAMLVVSSLAVKIVFYRCPHCHKLLPLRTFTAPDYCWRCGKTL